VEKFDIANANQKQVRKHIYQVISEVSGIDIENLSLNMLIEDDIAPNSIDRITLFMALEDEFSESIPEEEVRGFHTLGELIEYVEAKIRLINRN
jgi:acyl carrier protein